MLIAALLRFVAISYFCKSFVSISQEEKIDSEAFAYADVFHGDEYQLLRLKKVISKMRCDDPNGSGFNIGVLSLYGCDQSLLKYPWSNIILGFLKGQYADSSCGKFRSDPLEQNMENTRSTTEGAKIDVISLSHKGSSLLNSIDAAISATNKHRIDLLLLDLCASDWPPNESNGPNGPTVNTASQSSPTSRMPGSAKEDFIITNPDTYLLAQERAVRRILQGTRSYCKRGHWTSVNSNNNNNNNNNNNVVGIGKYNHDHQFRFPNDDRGHNTTTSDDGGGSLDGLAPWECMSIDTAVERSRIGPGGRARLYASPFYHQPAVILVSSCGAPALAAHYATHSTPSSPSSSSSSPPPSSLISSSSSPSPSSSLGGDKPAATAAAGAAVGAGRLGKGLGKDGEGMEIGKALRMALASTALLGVYYGLPTINLYYLLEHTLLEEQGQGGGQGKEQGQRQGHDQLEMEGCAEETGGGCFVSSSSSSGSFSGSSNTGATSSMEMDKDEGSIDSIHDLGQQLMAQSILYYLSLVGEEMDRENGVELKQEQQQEGGDKEGLERVEGAHLRQQHSLGADTNTATTSSSTSRTSSGAHPAPFTSPLASTVPHKGTELVLQGEILFDTNPFMALIGVEKPPPHFIPADPLCWNYGNEDGGSSNGSGN